MKFIVEMEDFYLDEEGDIEAALKQHIVSSVVFQIGKSIEEKVNKQIIKSVTEAIEKDMAPKIDTLITEIIKKGTIKVNSYDKEEKTFETHIRELFESRGGFKNPTQHIEILAKGFADEMRKRYDMAFASQVVIKLAENGLLKEGAIEKLLPTQSEA